MEKIQKKIKGNLKLIKKILGIYQKLVLLILIIYFGSNQKQKKLKKQTLLQKNKEIE